MLQHWQHWPRHGGWLGVFFCETLERPTRLGKIQENCLGMQPRMSERFSTRLLRYPGALLGQQQHQMPGRRSPQARRPLTARAQGPTQGWPGQDKGRGETMWGIGHRGMGCYILSLRLAACFKASSLQLP